MFLIEGVRLVLLYYFEEERGSHLDNGQSKFISGFHICPFLYTRNAFEKKDFSHFLYWVRSKCSNDSGVDSRLLSAGMTLYLGSRSAKCQRASVGQNLGMIN